MFWTEEDVKPVVNEVVKLFGPVGYMTTEKPVLCNVSLATKEFGKLWYGDITDDTPTLTKKMGTLAQSIKQKIYILSDDSFDFDECLLVINY